MAHDEASTSHDPSRHDGVVRVLLVSDRELVRRGIAAVLDDAEDIDVVGEAATARSARDLVAATEPTVVVVDVTLPDESGIDVARSIRSARPDVRCLILVADDDGETARAAALAGASGCVTTNIRASSFIAAVRVTAAGEQLNESASTNAGFGPAPGSRQSRAFDSLGLRELQVLALIAEGLTNRQTAEQLGLAEKTVKNYVTSLLSKLGLEHRTQAAILHLKHERLFVTASRSARQVNP
ncbi:response regulator transcription factor [Leifsonia sp. YAF41]|uniref:response regulator transcription factor n=1 Tax=Leifsonia sp. YAF41 TaxID=3233086 RepID=UPI003F9D2B31